jgi:hypothetical protein
MRPTIYSIRRSAYQHLVRTQAVYTSRPWYCPETGAAKFVLGWWHRETGKWLGYDFQHAARSLLLNQ